jgi:hypothetical protein
VRVGYLLYRAEGPAPARGGSREALRACGPGPVCCPAFGCSPRPCVVEQVFGVCGRVFLLRRAEGLMRACWGSRGRYRRAGRVLRAAPHPAARRDPALWSRYSACAGVLSCSATRRGWRRPFGFAGAATSVLAGFCVLRRIRVSAAALRGGAGIRRARVGSPAAPRSGAGAGAFGPRAALPACGPGPACCAALGYPGRPSRVAQLVPGPSGRNLLPRHAGARTRYGSRSTEGELAVLRAPTRGTRRGPHAAGAAA